MTLGLGPVFRFEWLSTSRNWRIYALRVLFGLGLLLILWMVSAAHSEPANGEAFTINEQAEAGKAFSRAIVGTELVLMILIAPAATASTLCLDKARGTLSHVLTTDLTNSEVILGKLAARGLPALLLIFSSLGVMAVCSLMGGIDPAGLTGAVLVIVGVTVFGASLALALSVWATKTHEVVMASYMILICYLCFDPALQLFAWTIPAWVPQPPEWLGLMNPFMLALGTRPGNPSIHLHVYFLLGTVGLSALMLLAATLGLRSASSRQSNRPVTTKKRKQLTHLAATNNGKEPVDRPRRSWRLLPAPSLDLNPVLWREWHRSKPSRWTKWIWRIYAIASVLATAFSVYGFWGSVGRSPQNEVSLILVNGFQVTIGLLLMSVTAAASLAEERVRGSLDVLLTTSLSTRSIVLGKWWGTFRTVPYLALMPAAMLAAATFWFAPRFGAPQAPVVYDSGAWGPWSRWLSVPLVVGLILAYGAALTSFGLVMATWIKRLDRAIMATVGTFVFVSLVVPIVIAMLMPHDNTHGPGAASISPFMGLAATGMGLLQHQPVVAADGWGPQIAWSTFWIMTYSSVALLLLKLELSRFNRKLGRTPDEGMEQRPAPPVAVKPQVVEEVYA